MTGREEVGVEMRLILYFYCRKEVVDVFSAFTDRGGRRRGGGDERAYTPYTHIKWRNLDVIPYLLCLIISHKRYLEASLFMVFFVMNISWLIVSSPLHLNFDLT